MKVADRIKELQPLNMDLYNSSFISGKQQNYIKTEYFFDKLKSRVFAKIYFEKEAQGAPKTVHGGAIASVLDETMGIITFLNYTPAVTASLTINYLNPLPVEINVLVETWIEEQENKKYLIKGRMSTENDLTIAEASGIFIKIPIDKIIEYKDYYKQFRADLDPE